MRKMVILPGRRIYHEQGCRYLKHTNRADWIFVELEKAGKKGRRPCKYCRGARFQLARKREVLNSFIKGKDMEYKLYGDAMYVKTEISCWKIVYEPGNRNFLLYHRNRSDKPVDFNHPDLEHYHSQSDKRCANAVIEFFRYIRSHDSFRKFEQETGGNMNMTNISPKYRRRLISRKRRQQQRRLDLIFEELEQKNPEYAELSCC